MTRRSRLAVMVTRRRTYASLFTLVLLLPLLSVAPSKAAAGDLDPSFGSGGTTTSPSGVGAAVAVQADGKVVVAGMCCLLGIEGDDPDFAVVRYNPDGTIDASFGDQGLVMTDFGGLDDATAVVIQSDGMIVAAGATSFPEPGFAVARYTTTGALDPTFSRDGMVTTLNGGAAADLIIQTVGGEEKLLVAGGGSDFMLARYEPNGSLDPTFGSAGTVVASIGPSADMANAVVVQRVGEVDKILAVGQTFDEEVFTNFALARFGANGALDTSFGTGGTVITSVVPDDDSASDMTIDGQGRILAVGVAIVEGQDNFAVIRYGSDGALDNTFGTGGKVIGPPGGGASAVTRGTGRIVVAGQLDDNFGLVGYSSSGALDDTFGGNGIVTTDLGRDDAISDLAVDGNGKLLAAGRSGPRTGGRFALARYEVADSTDPADLGVTVTGAPDPVASGARLTYRATVRNAGPGPAFGVLLTTNLDPRLVFDATATSQGVCSQNSGQVSCDLRSLAPGATATVDIMVTPSGEGSLANTVYVATSSSDPAPSNNSATAVVSVTPYPGKWVPASPMPTAVAGQTATLIPGNGKVLVTGGADETGRPLRAAQLYNPASGAWESAERMLEARTNHTATLLDDHRVLVVGGETFRQDGTRPTAASTEIYDSRLAEGRGQWLSAGSLQVQRARHAATRLHDGRVLVAGGDNEIPQGNSSPRSFSLDSVEIFDPSAEPNDAWQMADASLEMGRTSHTATTLADGSVLVVGGYRGSAFDSDTTFGPLAGGERLVGGHWVATPRPVPRRNHTATLMPSGQVLIVGGDIGSCTPACPTTQAQLYDPGTGTWRTTGQLANARTAHSAVLLPNGSVLVAGGRRNPATGAGFVLSSSELFRPGDGSWTTAGVMLSARHEHSAVLLPLAPTPAPCGVNCGHVLVVGGQGEGEFGTLPLAAAEMYVPAPEVASVSPTTGPPSGGTLVTLRGTGLGGTSTVRFGSVAATALTVRSSTEVVAVSPPQRPGVVPVTVTTAGGISPATPSTAFTYSGSPPDPTTEVIGGRGYWLVAADGGIFAFGDATFRGSTGALRLNRPIVGMAPTPSGRGYWLVAADGGIFAFGDAAYQGSTGAIRLNQPIVGMATSPSGAGYWLVGADGGIFAFGDAGFRGSTGAIRLNQPVVDVAPTPSGRGYWLVGADGGIFAFGDAAFRGSTGALRLNRPMVGMSPTPSGSGYWLVASDGGIFAFGDAPFRGSTGAIRLNQPVVGMAPTPVTTTASIG